MAAAYFARVDLEMRHLRALLAVAEELNFTRAAERLHLTQQALSGQIRQLEERVGARLVERDSRRVQLTRAGRTLCEHARPLLAGAEHAVVATRAAGEEAVRDRVWSDFWTAARHRDGTAPQIGASVTTLDGLMEAIGAGLGVAISVAPVVDMLGAAAGVVFRRVPELSPLDFWVARRAHDDRPHVLAFLDATAALADPSPGARRRRAGLRNRDGLNHPA